MLEEESLGWDFSWVESELELLRTSNFLSWVWEDFLSRDSRISLAKASSSSSMGCFESYFSMIDKIVDILSFNLLRFSFLSMISSFFASGGLPSKIGITLTLFYGVKQ